MALRMPLRKMSTAQRHVPVSHLNSRCSVRQWQSENVLGMSFAPPPPPTSLPKQSLEVGQLRWCLQIWYAKLKDAAKFCELAVTFQVSVEAMANRRSSWEFISEPEVKVDHLRRHVGRPYDERQLFDVAIEFQMSVEIATHRMSLWESVF